MTAEPTAYAVRLGRRRFPIGEVFAERLEDGKVYRVQYFEWGRFEW